MDVLRTFFSHEEEMYYKYVIAYCDRTNNMILIRESLIKSKPHYVVQETIDHEVGHCALNRIHRDVQTPFDDKMISVSVMFPSLTYNYQYPELKEMYRKELINKNKFEESEKLETFFKDISMQYSGNEEKIEKLMRQKEFDFNFTD